MLANLKNNFKKSTVLLKCKAVLSNCFHFIHKKLFWGVFSIIPERFFKFLFVGVLNSIFAYVIYAFLVTLGIIPNLALFLQYILGVLWNFKTTGSIVFKNHDNKLLFKFVLSYVFTFLLNSVLLKLLLNYVNDYIAQAILVPPVAVVSFLIFKFWVFK